MDHTPPPVQPDTSSAAPVATLTYRRQQYHVAPGQTVANALVGIGLHPEGILAVRGGTLIPPETRLKAGDQIKLIAQIYGG